MIFMLSTLHATLTLFVRISNTFLADFHFNWVAVFLFFELHLQVTLQRLQLFIFFTSLPCVTVKAHHY